MVIQEVNLFQLEAWQWDNNNDPQIHQILAHRLSGSGDNGFVDYVFYHKIFYQELITIKISS